MISSVRVILHHKSSFPRGGARNLRTSVTSPSLRSRCAASADRLVVAHAARGPYFVVDGRGQCLHHCPYRASKGVDARGGIFQAPPTPRALERRKSFIRSITLSLSRR